LAHVIQIVHGRRDKALPTAERSSGLADAADVLSDQLYEQLQGWSKLVLPHLDELEEQFRRLLKRNKREPLQVSALSAITFGAAARILSQNGPQRATALKFIEQVEYYGRRLAKLNLPPSAIVEALMEYDRLLTRKMKTLARPVDDGNFRWVREQLHFCVILTLNNAYYQVREAETQAFYELFRVELESRNLEELLQRFVMTLTHACQADAGHLYLVNDPEGAVWNRLASVPAGVARVNPVAVERTGRLGVPVFVDCRDGNSRDNGSLLLDPSWQKKYRTCWSIPLAQNGRVAGAIQLGFSKYYEWLPREQELLAAAAERCLMAAEKARLMDHLAASEEQIRKLAEHMLHVEEMERRRISRELHDEAGQSLLCIRLQIELLEQNLPESEAPTRAKLRDARDLTERTILEMRRLIAALSPAVLEQLGLGAALRQLVARFQRLNPIRVKLALSRLGGLPQQTEVIVYRLVQECFNNVAKHSGAKRVNVTVTTEGDTLRLTVEDDGVGFVVPDAFARRDSFGLAGMRERVTLMGGQFQIQSFPITQNGKTPNVIHVTKQLPLPPGRQRELRNNKRRGTKILMELPITRAVVHMSDLESGESHKQLGTRMGLSNPRQPGVTRNGAAKTGVARPGALSKAR
jgi:signal transduction histidine kinase